ncbi:low temperature requirement protein A [Streptomyces sp. NPDC050743]|uniref:low temperature requirement protein A n=1 Tax=Streptomyces sp. NPDC050743 TaxID=3365634 RepID=UPI0037B5CCA3
MTPWHPHHIAERYELFALIVLGESVAAATVAVRSAFDRHHGTGSLHAQAACSWRAWSRWLRCRAGDQACGGIPTCAKT